MPSLAQIRNEADTNEPAQGHTADTWQTGPFQLPAQGPFLLSTLHPTPLASPVAFVACMSSFLRQPQNWASPGSRVGCDSGPNFRGSSPLAGHRLRHLCQLQLQSYAGVYAHQRQPASGSPPPISGRSAPSFLLCPPGAGPHRKAPAAHGVIKLSKALLCELTCQLPRWDRSVLFSFRIRAQQLMCVHSSVYLCGHAYAGVCLCVCTCMQLPI